jgi:hypothetical protein
MKGNSKLFPIYEKYLRIKWEKPVSVFLGCIMPFLQAMLGSVLVIYLSTNNPIGVSVIGLFYWSMVAFNSKRIALGGWMPLTLFIIFATIGSVFGIYVSEWI